MLNIWQSTSKDDNIHDMTPLQYIFHNSPTVASSHSPYTNNLKRADENKEEKNTKNDKRSLILQNKLFRDHYRCPVKDAKAIRNAPPSDPFSKPAQERKMKKGKKKRKEKNSMGYDGSD